MAESYNTLAGLVQFNDKNLSDEEMDDLLRDAPFLAKLYSQAASNGTEHKYLVRTGASSAAFRAANAGLDKTTSIKKLVTDTLAIMDGSFHADVALAQEAKNGIEAYLDEEFMDTMATVMSGAEKQVLYGVGADATGFAGLADNAQLDTTGDGMVYSAGGTTADTQTSVFLIRSGKKDVSFIMGKEGEIVVEEDPKIVPWVAAAGASPTYPAYYVPATGYSGLQVGGAYSAARICNLHASDAGATLTDDMIYEALALFPSSRPPNMIVMNRQSIKQLRASRTAVRTDGAAAPWPTEVEGIEIVLTDSVKNTEAVVTV